MQLSRRASVAAARAKRTGSAIVSRLAPPPSTPTRRNARRPVIMLRTIDRASSAWPPRRSCSLIQAGRRDSLASRSRTQDVSCRPSARRCVARIDVHPRARPRLENHRHPLDRGHLVLVRALHLLRRDREDRSRYDVGRAYGEPGHGVLRLAAHRDHRLVLDLQWRQLEPEQRVPRAGQSPPERRRLHRLELERAVREETLGALRHALLVHQAPRASSTVRADTELPVTVSSPIETGSLKRRRPALPGFTYRMPSLHSTDGRCECPDTTTCTPAALGAISRSARS